MEPEPAAPMTQCTWATTGESPSVVLKMLQLLLLRIAEYLVALVGEFRALKKTEKWFYKTRHELGTLPMLILDSLFPPAGPPAGGAAAPRVRGRWWQAQELLRIVAGACMQKKKQFINDAVIFTCKIKRSITRL